MKQYEREYFVSRIRSGIFIVKYNGINLKILPPTIEDEFESNQVYMEIFNRAVEDEIKTFDEMHEWIVSKGLWTEKDDEREKGLEKDLEKLRIEIFKARNDVSKREVIRKYIRAGEEQQLDHLTKKHIYQENTCEGLAILEKSLELIRRCTYVGKELFDFESIDIKEVWSLVNSQTCEDKQLRELARSEPWRSTWSLRESQTYSLFSHNDRELTTEQKSLLLWSRMYDNIQESMDCPSEDVIEDDDMLDGWFLIQKQKREQEKAKSEFEDTMKNSKITNSDEIFVMAKSQEEAEKVDSMNTVHGKMTKRERSATIKSKGSVGQHEFTDEKLKLRQQSNQQFKDKFGR
jgi:hypothetical protein